MGIMDKKKLQAILKEQNIKDTAGLQAFLGEMTKEVIELLYEGEMTEYLGYEKHSSEEKSGENRRNGYGSKEVHSKLGSIDLSVPRDRVGGFEPVIVKTRQKDITGMEDKIISLYAMGTSTRDIRVHIKEKKECMGYYISEEAESAKYWDSVLLELKNRGVKDVLIFSVLV